MSLKQARSLIVKVQSGMTDASHCADLTEAIALIDAEIEERKLALWFTTDAINDHFDHGLGDDTPSGFMDLDADQLLRVGREALSDDALYQAFHQVLVDAIDGVVNDARLTVRVISERHGLMWTGTDPDQAEEIALMAAFNTGRTVYTYEGETPS